ncbi:MAG: hypothetical protein RRZ84_07840 [Romboutsia sp.]
MKGIKGFQKGRIVSQETRDKIGQANNGNFYGTCDYCSKVYHTQQSHYQKRKRHFCSRECYSKYRAELLPKEEQHAYGTGYCEQERGKRKKARTLLNHHLRDNNIERQPCEVCCNPKTEAHHDCYDKPLEIRWLCFKCHRKWHKLHDNHELIK